MLVLFRAKFACNLAISNPVFRWKSCKGSVWESVKKCSSLCKVARTRDWIARGLQAARSCTHAKHAEKLKRHLVSSRLELSAQSSHQLALS